MATTLKEAPAAQLEAARTAYKKFKEIATAKGIGFVRVYTSYSARDKLVRVKVYGLYHFQGQLPTVKHLGFDYHKPAYPGAHHSIVGYF